MQNLLEDYTKLHISWNTTLIKEIQNFLPHSDCGEMCKILAEASEKVCGHEAWDGYS